MSEELVYIPNPYKDGESGEWVRPKVDSDGWISVEDRLPGVSDLVIFVCARHKDVCVGSRVTNTIEFYDWLNTEVDGCPSEELDVTHWMPLPEPPKGDSDD